jgi:hypothetical protein
MSMEGAGCGRVRSSAKSPKPGHLPLHPLSADPGSAFVNVPAPAKDLKINSGAPQVYVKHTAESGKPCENILFPGREKKTWSGY